MEIESIVTVKMESICITLQLMPLPPKGVGRKAFGVRSTRISDIIDTDTTTMISGVVWSFKSKEK